MQSLESGVYYSFGPKSFIAKIVQGLIAPVAILLLTAGAFFIQDTAFAVMVESFIKLNLVAVLVSSGVILAVLVALAQLIVAWLYYRNTHFMISDNALYIRTGIIQRNEISIPLRHINNILQQQSITDRMFQVCTCTIEIQEDEVSQTAGTPTSSDNVVLYQLDLEYATPLRELLLSRSNTQRMVMVTK
ncbi:MAG: PH domain-containing protein [bacterium]